MQTKRQPGRPRSEGSVRAIAAQQQVSERMVYYAAQLRRGGRADLIEAVESGEMTMAAAIRELTGSKLPNRYEKLVLAWTRCDDAEREKFLAELARLGLVTPRIDDSPFPISHDGEG